MKIPTHQMEPWLIQYQDVPYNLGESGVLDQTVEDIFAATGEDPRRLLRTSLRNGDTRGSLELRQQVAATYAGVDPASVLVTTGTSEALFIYFQIRHRPGVNVVVPVPAFQTLYEVPRYLGYEVRTLPLRADDHFRPDLDALARLVDDRTQTIVVNNPHNPTGVRYTPRELDAILRLAEAHGAEVLVDEHYRFLPYAGDDPIPSLYGASDRVVAVGSMIKCCGCVGLRVGWILGPAELLDRCRDFRDYTTHTLSPMSDFLATTILAHWRPIVARYRDWIRANVARFGELVDDNPDLLSWIPPEAGVVAFPRLSAPGMTTEAFSSGLVERTGVFVLPGEVFDVPGHFRIGFGIPPASFSEAMSRMEGWLRRR
ncbi:aminotransferase class I/II-fold pyridoxal phosphate-dependent enzyme [Sorangium sp. So ce295]|uniref:aminotransferase class I/II-fold pyridoxal phosphate-dependent enzyme n=1 Tax=Sorangium sp. So ce295 TaxID=3133295 RepID=UPI003F5ED5DB